MTEVSHCGRCNRELTDKKSREAGFGPACLKKMREAAAKEEFEKNQIKMFEGAENNE